MKLGALLSVLASVSLLSAAAAPDDGGAPEDAGSAGVVDAGADAGPSEGLPFLGPVPEEKSKPPTPAEWGAARDLETNGQASNCKVRRVREWARVHCEFRATVSIEVVSGNGNDIFFSILSGRGPCYPDEQEGEICVDSNEVVFAMRRGDRRFLQFSQMNFGNYMAGGTVGAIVVSEVWLEDEPGPSLTIDDVGFY